MKKIYIGLVLLTGIEVAGCNSDRKTESSADSILTDTAIIDTAKTVDSAVRSNTMVDTTAFDPPVPQP